jgi:hypothetical protein
MSILSFLGGIFKPAADLVDELHFSGEEEGQIKIKQAELQNKLAEIESKVGLKLMDLQSKALDAHTKMAVAEQQHGNWLSKSWRPIVSLSMASLLIGMGFDIVPYKPLMVQVAGGFLGIYGIGRSYEKKK